MIFISNNVSKILVEGFLDTIWYVLTTNTKPGDHLFLLILAVAREEVYAYCYCYCTRPLCQLIYLHLLSFPELFCFS